jgi:Fe-S cluster assembly ATPase SufC
MSRRERYCPGDGPVLEVQDISVAVGRKRVISRLSLTIGPGEVHVLLGPNGGGKTTLLMSIMGMPGYRVTGGRILFMGEDVTGSSVDERARAGSMARSCSTSDRFISPPESPTLRSRRR